MPVDSMLPTDITPRTFTLSSRNRGQDQADSSSGKDRNITPPACSRTIRKHGTGGKKTESPQMQVDR